MTADDVLNTLAAIAAERAQLEAALADNKQREHDTIAAAWRLKVPPSRIASQVDRTEAHVRKLRPDDVPPARLGGGAAKRRRKPAGRR